MLSQKIPFKILEIYRYQNVQYAYVVKIQGQKIRVFSKVECFALFTNNKYICINAVLVNKKYIKGKGEHLKQSNINLQNTLSVESLKGVYVNKAISNLTFQKSMPVHFKTKRFLYDIVGQRIQSFKQSPNITNHAIAISGVRRIGKTMVLRQVYNVTKNSCFIDGDLFKGDMYELILTLKKNKIHYVFVDEVCKLDYASRGELISLIKNGTEEMFFVLTGSVPAIVNNIAESICYCEIFNLPPIMYVERLSWKYNVTYKDTLNLTSNAKFISWLKQEENVGGTHEVLEFIKGIVRDTMSSFTGNDYSAFKDLFLNKNITLNDLRALFFYVAGCQLLYIKVSENKYTEFPVITNNVIDIENDIDMRTLRKKLIAEKNKFTTQQITAFCELLEDAYLVKPLVLYDENSKALFKQLKNMYNVPAYIFEYPQIIMDYFGLGVAEQLINNWVEYSILLKTNYCYWNVGKYRVGSGTKEVDVVYSVSQNCIDELGVIEVKNRACNSNNISQYNQLGLEGVQEFILTCNDVEYQSVQSIEYSKACRMRNDVVLVLLELYYIQLCLEDNYHTKKPISLMNLYKKYKEK